MKIWKANENFYFGSLTFPGNVKDRSRFAVIAANELIYESETSVKIYIKGTQFNNVGDSFKSKCTMIGTFDESQVGTPSSLITTGDHADRPVFGLAGRMYAGSDDQTISVDVGNRWMEFRNNVWGDRTIIYIDPVSGDDDTGNGTVERPFATISAAADSVSVPEASGDGIVQWLREKIVFALAPGVYVEGGTESVPNDVVLNIRRARVQLLGTGVLIMGNVVFDAHVADLPYGDLFQCSVSPYVEYMVPPWNDAYPNMCLEISGDDSGGMEAGNTSLSIVIMGTVKMVYETVTGLLWQQRVRNNFFLCNHTNIRTGFQVYGHSPAVTTEWNDFSCEGGNMGAMSSVGSFILKCSNGMLKSPIGPYASVYEIDNCRIQGGFDRTYGGATGNVTFLDSTSYSALTCCAVAATTFNVGNGSASVTIPCDSTTARQFVGKTLNAGTGTVTIKNNDVCSGTTTARPTSLVGNGFPYYDTTLSKPIWKQGTGWIDAAGNVV